MIKQALRNALDFSPLDVYRGIKSSLARSQERRSDGCTPEQLRRLGRMRDDVAAAGAPFVPAGEWEELAARFRQAFRAEGIHNPEEQLFNLSFSGFASGDPRLHRYVCWMYRTLLEKRDALGLMSKLKATCKAEAGFAYELDGDFLSLDLLLSIDDFYSLYQLNPMIATEPVVVAELGGGWGRLGYVIASVNPNSTYCMFDLPEALLISQTYLPKLLRESEASTYESARSLTRVSRENLHGKNLWFFGPQALASAQLGTFDYVVNIASFQEMPLEYVRSYLQHFGKAAAGGSCFLRQRKLGGKLAQSCWEEIDGLPSYPFPREWKRRFFRSSTMSDEFFEIGFALPGGRP